MEWYFGSGIDDLVVPKDQELTDGVLSSPEVGILSKWGTYTPENFMSPKKYFTVNTNAMDEVAMDEDFNFIGFCTEVTVESSIQDKSHSEGSCTCTGLSEESQQRTAISNERTDYQQDLFVGIEQLDDLFLNSLMEDLPGTEDLHESFYFDHESQYGVSMTNELATSLSLDSQRNSSDKHIIWSSKYLKTHAFSPSVDCQHGEVLGSSFIPCNLEHKFLPVKALSVKPQSPVRQNIANELLGDGSSTEEFVLQELKMVMDQMPNKIRICFRDALYRLAENSKQYVPTPRENGECPPETPMASHDINMRPVKSKAMESETNVIDRAIASLLYNTMDLHVRDLLTVATPKSKEEVMIAMESPMNQHFRDSLLEGDAEVPSMNLDSKIK